MRANSNSRAKINYEVRGEKLIIEVKWQEELYGNQTVIFVWRALRIYLQTSVSALVISIQKIKNNIIKLGTSSGKIHAKNIEASEIRFVSSSGDVLGEDLIGKVTSTF